MPSSPRKKIYIARSHIAYTAKPTTHAIMRAEIRVRLIWNDPNTSGNARSAAKTPTQSTEVKSLTGGSAVSENSRLTRIRFDELIWSNGCCGTALKKFL